MASEIWLKHRELEAGEERLWELFHENSKVRPFDRGIVSDQIARLMADQYDHFAFDGCARIPLGPPGGLEVPLGAAIRRRRTPQALAPRTIGLVDLSTLLFHANGITRPETDGLFPRPFRAAPSGGAMYPLDLFIHTAQIEGLQSGLYHYNPHRHDSPTSPAAIARVSWPMRWCRPTSPSATFRPRRRNVRRSTQKYDERATACPDRGGPPLARTLLPRSP